MFRKVISFSIVLVFFSYSYVTGDKQPDWVQNLGISVSHPENSHITGFGIGEDESLAERRSIAEQNARSDLSSRFIINIQSEIISVGRQKLDKFYTSFSNTVSAQTQLTMIDVDVLQWDDKKNKRTYALAVMEIEKAIVNYSHHFEELIAKIKSHITAAEKFVRNGDKKHAITAYRKTFPLFIEAGETHSILRLLQGKSPIPSEGESQNDIPVSLPEIESEIQTLLGSEPATVKDCALSIAEQLFEQYESSRQLAVFPFTYRDTDFSSYFSSSFLPILELELTHHFNVMSRGNSGTHKSGSQDVLTGTYWIEGGRVRIIAFITDLQTGAKKASASVEASEDIFTNAGIELLPRNFQQAMEDSKVFLKQDVIPGTLLLEVWTSKGDKSLIFKENEETEISVRVNKTCYLQVLYHMANGVRLLLYDNYYIDVSKVNKVFTLPDTFYFVPPLGVERLQVFASTGKFDDVRTNSVTFDDETYDNVFAEDFKAHTIAMRGIKKKKSEKQLAEKIITITTIPR